MERFTESHLPEISSWFADRDQPRPPDWAFSSTGFIIKGVAAGFLFVTNSKIAYVDLYISNPHVSAKLKFIALDEISRRIIQESKDWGIKLLVCNTRLHGIERLAKRFGFVDTGTHIGLAKEM